jgi:citrate lyase subunit beta/citryl-CoA lyase
VVDGISIDIKDMHSFEMACRLTRDLGFDGKSLVHPNQLAYCNDAFTPKATEIAFAYEVIQALETAHQAGRGTIMLNGRLVEQHHVAASKRIIALAQMIKELEAA